VFAFLTQTDPFYPKIQNSKAFFHSLDPLPLLHSAVEAPHSPLHTELLLQIALSFPSRSQTAILHNCITDPSHNSEPPSRLHTHSVQPSCKSSSKDTSNQPSGTSHADVMQGRPSQTQNGSKICQLISLISGRSKVRVT
jgi:hypothetical protein